MVSLLPSDLLHSTKRSKALAIPHNIIQGDSQHGQFRSKIILFSKNTLFGNVNKFVQILTKYQLQLGHKTKMNR